MCITRRKEWTLQKGVFAVFRSEEDVPALSGSSYDICEDIHKFALAASGLIMMMSSILLRVCADSAAVLNCWRWTYSEPGSILF